MTKIFKNKISVLFVFPLIILLSIGCQKINEQAPFFDGFYLNYSEVFGDPNNSEDIIWTRVIEYRFKKLEDGNFHISQEVSTHEGKILEKKVEPTTFPMVGDDLSIDNKGIVLKGGDLINFINEHPSYLWLPFDKRKKGTAVIENILKVQKRMRWEDWDVLLVKGILGNHFYYEMKTGILVGTENLNGKLRMKLVDSNQEKLKGLIHKKP
jgi:hypothetical protein